MSGRPHQLLFTSILGPVHTHSLKSFFTPSSPEKRARKDEVPRLYLYLERACTVELIIPPWKRPQLTGTTCRLALPSFLHTVSVFLLPPSFSNTSAQNILVHLSNGYVSHTSSSPSSIILPHVPFPCAQGEGKKTSSSPLSTSADFCYPALLSLTHTHTHTILSSPSTCDHCRFHFKPHLSPLLTSHPFGGQTSCESRNIWKYVNWDLHNVFFCHRYCAHSYLANLGPNR
jgi:hypothetical protein